MRKKTTATPKQSGTYTIRRLWWQRWFCRFTKRFLKHVSIDTLRRCVWREYNSKRSRWEYHIDLNYYLLRKAEAHEKGANTLTLFEKTNNTKQAPHFSETNIKFWLSRFVAQHTLRKAKTKYFSFSPLKGKQGVSERLNNDCKVARTHAHTQVKFHNFFLRRCALAASFVLPTSMVRKLHLDDLHWRWRTAVSPA